MSGYLKNITVVEQFDGDAVTVVLRPLAMTTLLNIRSSTADGEDALIRAFQSMLPGQIVSLSGLRDAAGAEITAEEVCTAAYFGPLVMSLGMTLLTEATPKNAPPPSAP